MLFKFIPILVCCLIVLTVSGQNDLLLLKKKDQTIQTWTSGSYIAFQFSNKQWLTARIQAIRNDSLVINLFTVRQLPNQFGLPTVDTGWLGLLKLHINEVVALPKKYFRSGIIRSGALFQLGGGAYTFLNVFNSLVNSEPVFATQNLSRLGVAAGIFAIGTALSLTHTEIIKIGKKHKLITLSQK